MKPDLESPEQARERLDSEALTDAELARLWARIHARAAAGSRRGAVIVWGALAMGAIAGIVAIMTAALPSGEEVAKKDDARQRCALDASRAVLFLDADCEPAAIQVNGDEWVLSPGSTVSRVADGANVERGFVIFRVRHRAATPFFVKVSHGVVRVVGTVFRIEQSAASGSVHVTEGVVEFVWDDGTREPVTAGQSLHFPKRAAAASPTVAVDAGVAPAAKRPDAPRSHKPGPDAATKPSSDLESVMDRLLQLKSQKRFVEAASLLRQALSSGGLGPVQRERLSYELGLALEASGQKSCAHWKAHVASFGTGRHGEALGKRLAACQARGD